MPDFDPRERQASALGCAAGIGGVAVLLLAAVAAVVALAWRMTAAP